MTILPILVDLWSFLADPGFTQDQDEDILLTDPHTAAVSLEKTTGIRSQCPDSRSNARPRRLVCLAQVRGQRTTRRDWRTTSPNKLYGTVIPNRPYMNQMIYHEIFSIKQLHLAKPVGLIPSQTMPILPIYNRFSYSYPTPVAPLYLVT